MCPHSGTTDIIHTQSDSASCLSESGAFQQNSADINGQLKSETTPTPEAENPLKTRCFSSKTNGEGGIRTLERANSLPVFETGTQSSQTRENKDTYESNKSCLSPSLAQIIQKHPELSQLIEAWPTLTDPIKAGIAALVFSTSQCLGSPRILKH